MRRTSAQSGSDADRLREEQHASDQAIREQGDELGKLRLELAELRESAVASAKAGGRPARIRVFAGNQYVGAGWYVPPKSGVTNGPVVDPLVFLDMPVQRAAAVGGAVQGGVSTVPAGTTINYNYPSGYDPYGYVWWPSWWVYSGNGTNCPPGQGPTPPTPPTDPTSPTPGTPPTSPAGVQIGTFDAPRRTRPDYWVPSQGAGAPPASAVAGSPRVVPRYSPVRSTPVPVPTRGPSGPVRTSGRVTNPINGR
jgi:hypothetical protein